MKLNKIIGLCILIVFSIISINATINNSVPIEINSYQLDFDYFNCSLEHCGIELENESYYKSLNSNGTTFEYTETDAWTNTINAFDYNDSSYASMLRTSSTSDQTVDSALGKTFSSRYVEDIKIKTSFNLVLGGLNKFIKLQTYNGSAWIDESTLSSGASGTPSISYDNIYSLNKTVSGIRIYYEVDLSPNNKQWDRRLYTLEYTVPSYTFNENGNQSYNILSSNSTYSENQSGIVLVNPYQYFRLQNNVSSSYLTGYNIDVDNSTYSSTSEYVIIKLYDLGFGDFNFTGYKTGYNNVTSSYNFNSTTDLNETIIIEPVTLNINIYDIDTLSQIYFNVTILNSSGSSVVFNNQFNFSKSYEDIPTGDLEIIVSSKNYSTARFYNSITPYTSISIIGYLTTSTDIVLFNIRDTVNDDNLDGVLVEAQQLVSGTWLTIGQSLSGSNGNAYIYLNPSLIYKFIFTKTGYNQAVVDGIPGVTSYSVKLSNIASQFDFFTDVNVIFNPSSSILYTNTTYNLTGFITGSSFTLITYKIYDQNGTVLYTINSTNPTGTSFKHELNINSTMETLTQEIKYYRDGDWYTETAQYNVRDLTTSFITYLKNNYGKSTDNESAIVRWVIMILCIGASYLIGQTIINGGGLVSAIVISFFIWVEWIPPVIGAVLVFSALVLWLGGKR